MSPKSVAFPVVEIVTNCMVFVAPLGTLPPSCTALVFDAHEATDNTAAAKSPKSCALPSVERVINSIVFVLADGPGPPPILRPLILLLVFVVLPLVADNSPNCVADPPD